MCNILTALIKEDIYYSLICCGLFLEEQKGCSRGTRGSGGLQYIYILAHPQGNQNEEEKCSHGID